MAQERNRAATVITQEGEQLRVEHEGKQLTVRMRGFPDGFRLRPGGRVILFDEPSGPVARPLVRAVRSRAARETLQRRGTVEVEGRRLEMQESTIVEEPRPTAEEPADEYVLWVVERGAGEAGDQVIAARRRR
jgi:hypothetical protein